MYSDQEWNPLSDRDQPLLTNNLEGEEVVPPENIHPSDQDQLHFYSSLDQEFSDFSFLFDSYSKDEIRVSQVINDLNRNLDNFLNDNIKCLLSLARGAESNEEYEGVLNILKIVIKRRLFASKEILILVKHCLLIRGMIQIIDLFPNQYKLKFYRLILSPEENHYNSSFSNTQIMDEIDRINKEIPGRMGDSEETLFPPRDPQSREINPLLLLYINDLTRTNFISTVKDTLPWSLQIINSVSSILDSQIFSPSITQEYVLDSIQSNLDHIYNLPKNDVESLMRHCSVYFLESPQPIKSRFYSIEMQMASEMFQSSSIERKIWALSLINEKIKLIKSGYKNYTIEPQEFLAWIEKNRIYENVIQFNVHSEIINRSNQLVKFLYDNDRIEKGKIEEIIQLALKSESDSITAFVHTFLVHLEYKDLELAFDFIVGKVEDENHMSGTMILLLESVISGHKLSNSGRGNVNVGGNKRSKGKEERHREKPKGEKVDLFDDGRKQREQGENGQEVETEIKMDEQDEQGSKESLLHPKIKIVEVVEEEGQSNQPSQLSLKIFKYIISYIDQYPLIPTITKLINNQPAIFSQIPHFLITSIRQNRPCSNQLLDSIIKLPFPIPKDKGFWTRSQLIGWMVNERLFQYLIKGLSLNRFQNSITQQINLLILVARYNNKPFQLSHVQHLWRILGLRQSEEKERQQFFVFVKDCLTKCNNMLFTQESIHYIYFQILLKLHAKWFSLKVYECFEMFFIRLNQDCKLINHSSRNNGIYELVDPELIAFKKVWYIYLRGEDPRVTKKCREFLCRIITKFDYSDKIGQNVKEHYTHIIINNIKSSHQVITSTEGEHKQEYAQIGRCLDILIKLIEDIDGINITGDKLTTGEEWSIIIINNCQNSLPPKKFTLKVNANSTLRMVREMIGAKLNPPKKQNQIKLMTRGQYPKGENMTLKQLKFINKQTFMIESNDQLLPGIQNENQNFFNEATFEMLKAMFPNHEESLIRFVMNKRLGEDEQAIAEVLLDEETVGNYTKEIQQQEKVVPKQLSEFLVTNFDVFEIFFEILSLHSEEHSYMIWKIISHLPNNSHSVNLIKTTILETSDWNQIFCFSSKNLFKTLYHLQLLKSILTGGATNTQITRNEQIDLTNKFVAAGGLEHLYKNLKSLMSDWKGDFLQAKLLSYLIEVFKIYLKPHLTQIVNQPLNFMFKEVVNYKKHLKQLDHHQIRHIITEIVSPEQTNTITSKSYKSFSFKGQSVSSNATPGFKSPNDSGRNSPHSETPKHEKQEDNISVISMSKSINTSKNSKKRRPMIEHSFEARMRQNMDLQQSLKQLLNVNELVGLIFKNLKFMIENCALMGNEDVIHFSEELFEILFPILLINNSYSLIFNSGEITEIIAKGMGVVGNEEMRRRLVYLVFLLCVIEEEDKLIVEDDDELFLTEAKKLKPRIFFLKTLLPIFETESNLYETYFLCLSKLIKEIDPVDLKEFFDASKFAEEILRRIKERPLVETLDTETEDYTLNGLLMLLQVLLEKYKGVKTDCNKLIYELSEDLFKLPNEFHGEVSVVNHPKYKRRKTRRRCFDILIELCKDSEENKSNLSDILTQYCTDLNEKEYYDAVLIRSEKYSGLKNLGATCYINSLLQQFHKNTELKYLLTTPSTLPITPSHPLHQLSHLFSSLTLSLMSAINPLPFIKTVRFHGNQEINTKIQQDVNEFFMAFVDLMERNQAKQILQSCLMGEICNEITCCEESEALKFVKKRTEEFYTIGLDIKGKKNLQEALQFFVKGDLLDGDNKYYSEELDSKVKAIKRSYFKSLPNSLVFTLKRFQFDYNTMLRYKLNDYFEFPLELDLLKYTEQVLSEEIEQTHDQNYFKYRLVGVLVHSGTAESGHYYSYIKDSEKWYQFNDSQVTEFNIANLKGECFGGEENRGYDLDNRSRNAYLLFYERVEPITTPFSQHIKQRQITGQYADLVWKQNFKFLKSRLVYDIDFIKFVEEIKSDGSNLLLEKIQGKPLQKCFIEFQNNDLDVANPDIIMAMDQNEGENVMREIPIDDYDERTPLMEFGNDEDNNFLGSF